MTAVLEDQLVLDPFTTDTVLNRAADIWEERGRTFGYLCDAQGRVCALGAIGLALGYDEYNLVRGWSGEIDHHPAVAQLADHLRKNNLAQVDSKDNYKTVYRWNDSYVQTAKDAANEMRLAAVSS